MRTYYPIRRGVFARTVGAVRAVDGVNLTLQAGETVDAGISHATIVTANLQVRNHAQLASVAAHPSRSREQVLKAVGETLQR